MKKFILMSVAVLALTFTSCGKSDASKEKSDEKVEMNVTELIEKQNKGEELSGEELQALISKADTNLPEFQQLFDAMKSGDMEKMQKLTEDENLKKLDKEMGDIMNVLGAYEGKMDTATKAKYDAFMEKVNQMTAVSSDINVEELAVPEEPAEVIEIAEPAAIEVKEVEL